MILFGYKELKILGAFDVSMYFLTDATEPRNKTVSELSVSEEAKASSPSLRKQTTVRKN
jgi:hypothetical protein